jgi:predicted ATP-grasp superfamily ATP-dependent carboligase
LLVASGVNLPLFVYDRLTGREPKTPSGYRIGMRLWKPVGDFAAYRQLNKMELLTFWAWIRSIMHPQIVPVFRWNDPLPALLGNARWIGYAWSRLWRVMRSRKDNAAAAPLHLSPLPQPSTPSLPASVPSDLHLQTEPVIELPQK